MSNEPVKISLIITIVNRGRGEKAAEIAGRYGGLFNLCMLGRGTADSVLLDYLGLGETEKDVMLSALASAKAPLLLSELSAGLELARNGNGIAFTIPASSVGGPKTMHFLAGRDTEACEEEEIMNEKKCELILTVVSRGLADLVMEAAKEHGATGGTILHARGTGIHEAEKFFGIPITPEKEVVMILAKKECKRAIMQAVCEKAGLSTEAHGISFSLPVNDVVGASSFQE